MRLIKIMLNKVKYMSICYKPKLIIIYQIRIVKLIHLKNTKEILLNLITMITHKSKINQPSNQDWLKRYKWLLVLYKQIQKL